MGLNGVIRPGLIQMKVLDLDKTVEHYVNILGLNEVCRTEDGRVCLKGYDEFDHHSVVLKKADEAGFDYAALKVDSDARLDELEKRIEAFGYRVDHVAANSDQPGFGRRIGFTLCTGHRLELYADVEQAAQHPEILNPNI